MITNLPTYDEARKAIRGGKDPVAFMHLGILYAQGIGVTHNHILAHYFFKKALDMGCKEAEQYMYLGYEAGTSDFGAEIEAAIGDVNNVSPTTIAKLKAKIEKERIAGNIGNLSKIRHHLPLFYPEYNHEKAISDILNDRHTIDADILFTLSTADNRSEVYLASQDRLLEQLYAPITTNTQLYKTIVELDDTDLISKDESELAQCIVNLTSSYSIICKKYGITPHEIYSLDSLCLYPYIKIADLVLLRQQGFRALLSIKDVDSAIQEKFLNCLDSDEKLLNVCEEIQDQDIQLFLISFVELNIDIESLEITSLSLLKSYRKNNTEPLAEHLNDFVNRLEKCNIQHDLSVFTTKNLPPIDLSVSYEDASLEKPLSNEIGVKGKYSILQNENGEIMVMIDAREGEPDDPRLIYDGKMALLFRNFDSNVLFRNIDPKAHEALREATEVLVIEVQNDDVAREYVAPIRRVKDVSGLIA